jgi:hypothetical protein
VKAFGVAPDEMVELTEAVAQATKRKSKRLVRLIACGLL